MSTLRLPIARLSVAFAFFLVLAADAVASGFPPFAVNDSITVKRNGSVSVLDSGQTSVLDNDFDFERDTLTAELVVAPKRGQLTLNPDGTFLYIHDGSLEEDDEFGYRAFDGTRYSRRIARVSIRVVPGDPIPPEIVGQRELSFPEDESLEITLSDLEVVDPDSSYPQDFTLELGAGENYELVGTTILPSADFNGALSVPVRVSDGTNFSNWFDLLVSVLPQNDPPYIVSEIADQEAREGLEFVLSVAEHFDDIDANDSLRFGASGLPPSGSISLNASTGILQGTPIRADAIDVPYSVLITATDLAGSSAELTFALTIFAEDRADMAISSNVAQNPTLTGEHTAWRIVVENRGPAELDQGELIGNWTTSGPILSLVAPQGCTIFSNDSSTPGLRCPLVQFPVGAAVSIDVQGMQDGDGDNTLIARVLSDDPEPGNNNTLVSAQVAMAFSEGPTQVLNEACADLAVADFNLDGLPDLVATNAETVVHLNTGDRMLQDAGTVIGRGGSHLSLLDWDGDGLQDVAVAGPSAERVLIYLGDSSGIFQNSIEIPTVTQGDVAALTAIDVDADGKTELVLGGSFGALVLGSDGAGQPSLDALSGAAVIDVEAADIDQDGFSDLITVAASDRAVQILRNSGAGSFALQDVLRKGSVSRVSAADLNGSGTPGLQLSIDGDDLAPPRTLLMNRTSSGTYVVAGTLGASPASDLLTGDIDGDGSLDIVVVNEAGVHQLYLAGPGAGYTLGAEQIVSPGMQTGVLADYNLDGSVDLVLAGTDATSVELHANNGIGRLGLGDTAAPELTLLGEPSLTIPSGTEYVDAGATALDDIDGDLTSAITTTGTVNSAVIGTYTLTYSVSDRASNTSQVTRTVTVGVNQGGGGGGGGAMSLWLLMVLLMFALITRSAE